MEYRENYSLQTHNTLSLNQQARFFVPVHNEQELAEAVRFAHNKQLPLLILGEGSNLVLSRDYAGLVVQNLIKGVKKIDEDADTIRIEVGAGENWHRLVSDTLQQHWYGLENLALIPGTVGAAPVQNIGAYGVEVCAFVDSVCALDSTTGEWKTFRADECHFAYRDSIFKRETGRWLISRVCLRLFKKPQIHAEYQALQNWFERQGVERNRISPQQIYDAVIDIRRSRLPDPVHLANAGSFFKNPLVTAEQYRQLQQQFPALVSYPTGDSHRKLAAAWLIDQAGWKGFRNGRVGVHEHQALVLVNYGGASGAEILALASQIGSDIKKRYDITLEIEPAVI